MCRPTRRLALASAVRFAVEPLELRALLAGSIAGQVFFDINGNGVFDGGESTLNGTTVYLDLNNSATLDGGDASVVTSGTGNYSFGSLADGAYTIREVVGSSSVLTTGAFLSATIAGGNAVTGKNFGNFFTSFVGTNGSDSWTIRIDPANASRLLIIEQLLGQMTPTNYGVAKSLLSSINMIGSGGDDSYLIEYTNGNPIPSGGLNIDAASASTTAGDRVTVTGSSAADTISIVSLDVMSGGGAIAVKDIEKVTINGNLGDDHILLGRSIGADLTADAGGGNDTLTFTGSDAIDVISIQSTSVSDGMFAPIFSAVENLVVAARAGADTITLNGSVASMPVIVQGGDGNDTLTIATAPLSAISFQGGLTISDHDTLNLNAGTSTFATDAASITSNLTLNVANSATANFLATQHLEALTVAGQATLASGENRVLVTRSLAITATGKLDLTNNDLVVNYSSVSPIGTWTGSVYTGVTALLASGFNGGAWTGNGIRTSSVTALTTLGVAEASQALGIAGSATAFFGTEIVDGTSVLVKYTYGGDANLSGNLDVDDYGQIDFNSSTNGALTGYFNGDFDFNGILDVDDYGVIDFVLNIQGPPL